MNFQWLTALRDYGASMYDTVSTAPGLLVYFVALSLPILGWFILHLYRNIARNVEAILRIVAYRISHALASCKTYVVCKVRQIMPRRRTSGIDTAPSVEFDDLDLAVLRAAASRGPGFAINASQLADKFRLRPAQVERSLDKLSRNKMLDFAVGTESGSDNYRLTPMGTAFMSTWHRQAS